MGLTTHVLDTSRGKPAHGIEARLEFNQDEQWQRIAIGKTNEDGRIPDFLPKDFELKPGVYRITFETGKYFAETKTKGFYPYVKVVFEIENTDQHYHVPLLLNPYGYSTYRGS